MIRLLLRPASRRRCSDNREIFETGAVVASSRPVTSIQPFLGPGLPFAALAVVTVASLVHWTMPIRQRIQWQVEEKRCVLQLHEFHRAFEAYRRDNGTYPRHPMALYPKYVRDRGSFFCPAYRNGRFHRPLVEKTRYAGNWFNYTYYFPYLVLHSREEAKRIDRARVPLMFCGIHAEARYEADHRQPVTPSRRRDFIDRYGVPYLPVLRQNGRVDLVDDLVRGPEL